MRLSASMVKPATISDVARSAGVSIGTASMALNGSTRCSASTAERVRAAAAAMGYLPNHAAKSLRRQVSDTVALVIPDIGNPVYVMMAKAVQQVVKAHGYHLTLISTDSMPQEEIYAVQSLTRRSVDGLILCALRVTPELVASIETAPGPVCVIGRVASEARVDNVRVDSQRGVALAIAHLVAAGRRTIGFINGPGDTVPASARVAGYREALEAHGLPVDESLIVQAEFSVAGGHEGVNQLWGSGGNIDGLFCANDVMAIGAMRALRERAIQVPDDVAVVGMDDIPEGMLCTPSLTSVSLQAASRARTAAEMVFEALADPGLVTNRRVVVEPRLVVRESTLGVHAQVNA